MCKFTFKIRVAKLLVCIGFTEILEIAATFAANDCEVKGVNYRL
jgi:hypothetical protein